VTVPRFRHTLHGMSLETLLALAGFVFVMSITPGPGNFLLLASGANFGFARSLPLILGISGGFLGIVLLVGLGLGPVFERFPEIYLALQIACGLYILWLAWKIATSRSLGSGEAKVERPIGFIAAAMLQLFNPKSWAVALIVNVSYTVPDRLLFSLLAVLAVIAVVNLPALSVWALSGSALRNALAKGNRIVVFNIAMAALLILSMIPVFVPV
jgi:threonine/homoserine/homoserine lactone efflux protein